MYKILFAESAMYFLLQVGLYMVCQVEHLDRRQEGTWLFTEGTWLYCGYFIWVYLELWLL
jgi:hypothetical protein